MTYGVQIPTRIISTPELTVEFWINLISVTGTMIILEKDLLFQMQALSSSDITFEYVPFNGAANSVGKTKLVSGNTFSYSTWCHVSGATSVIKDSSALSVNGVLEE